MAPKYNATVTFTLSDINVHSILTKVSESLKESGATEDEVLKFKKDALSLDYLHLITTCMKYVSIK